MGTVCCFGEVLLRFSVDADSRWLKQNQVPVHLGGAELNVARALALWGKPVSYATAMPDHSVSHQTAALIREMGIDVDSTTYAGERIGTFYIQQGADMKNAGVIYDRAGSSFATLEASQVNWDAMFQGVSWFHFSAISPAVSAAAAELCKAALQEATARGIFTSVDLNYRAKLWKYGKTPLEIMPELAAYCDLIMGNVWAAERMLGIPVGDHVVPADIQEVYLAQGRETAAAIQEKFPRCKWVANTWRFDRESLTYYASLHRDGELFLSKTHSATAVVDRVGSGDCFMGGLIYGMTSGLAPQQTVDFAAAAAFGKLFIVGDATTQTVEQINKHLLSYAS